MKFKMIHKLVRIVINIIFNDIFIYWFIRIYEGVIRSKVNAAYLKFNTNLIQNKGIGSKIKHNVKIPYLENLSIGNYVSIGEGAFLFAKGGISIGDNTQISRNVLIYSANHDINGSAIPYDDQYIEKPVTIGKSVWIGMNVVITPGVTIGDGAIIGMGTVISSDVPEGAIVVGAKQRIVNYRDMDDFKRKDISEKWFGKEWPNL